MTKKQHFLLHLIIDWALVLGLYIFAEGSNFFILKLLSIIFIGMKQYSIGEALLHELAHQNYFNKPSLKIMNILLAYPFFETIENYIQEHGKHHADLGGKSDPFQDFYKKNYDKQQSSFFFNWWLKPLMGFVGIKAITTKIGNWGKRTAFAPIVFWWVIVLFSWSYGYFYDLVLYWIIPLIFVFNPISYWSDTIDHYQTDSVRDHTGFLYNFLISHNSGYHSFHHDNPTIPFHMLRHNYKKWEKKDSHEYVTSFYDAYKKLKK